MDAIHYPIFDSHFHIIDPRFPLAPNQGFVPEPYSIEDYRTRTAAFNMQGGAIVSGSFQAHDQGYLLEALRRLGPAYVGVTQLPVDVSDEIILSLHKLGVRAVRFNLRRGGTEQLNWLEEMARRIFSLAGWHIEVYIDSRDLSSLAPRLLDLPKVCIDHLGLSREGFPELLRLVERGVYVKASGFGRVNMDVPTALREITRRNPHALLFGTDLPCTRSPRTFQDADVTLVLETLGEEMAHNAFIKNALALYKPRQGQPG
ncbi:amidohydrolase family protein [Ktedonospora formicarum]|uniref:2-pyrone-4,6-dicarboxylate hydrolase n=1 Tax=Ktedonospora formicarum TaxID=2778364 RepID=A0A8J3HZ57_9CHLR|nr:amidohydrolase family protein [Ktedonospora formicarum]GHO41949.1 2-pyrone-4,6-dicarboxylate hydrolase [Ktedonospora formicarum]